MKTWKVNLTNGESLRISAQIVTYDQAGNLIFMNEKKTLATANNPEGRDLDLVHCVNSRAYIDYSPAQTVQ